MPDVGSVEPKPAAHCCMAVKCCVWRHTLFVFRFSLTSNDSDDDVLSVSADIFHGITLLRLKEIPRFLKLFFFSETLSFYFSLRQRTLSNSSVSPYPLYFVFFLLHFSCKTVIPEELDFVSCAYMSKNITFATVMVTCISSVTASI